MKIHPPELSAWTEPICRSPSISRMRAPAGPRPAMVMPPSEFTRIASKLSTAGSAGAAAWGDGWAGSGGGWTEACGWAGAGGGWTDTCGWAGAGGGWTDTCGWAGAGGGWTEACG
jgi:hypothetical protein